MSQASQCMHAVVVPLEFHGPPILRCKALLSLQPCPFSPGNAIALQHVCGAELDFEPDGQLGSLQAMMEVPKVEEEVQLPAAAADESKAIPQRRNGAILELTAAAFG